MPDDVLWKLEPHTLGKHRVLRKYLNSWFPILSKWNGRILFIDGFAGPGEYADGEPGSPLIALEALADHRAKIDAEVGFVFIEKDKARAKHLEHVIEGLSTPANSWVLHECGEFDENMTSILNMLDEEENRLAPSLVMVDPFGISGTPMHLLNRIMKNPKCELYVSFMYEAINRFKTTSEFAPHLDGLFGTQDWRNGVEITNSSERKQFFFDLYENQLRDAGAEQVVHFELFDGNRLVYAIFFATTHLKGSDRMKAAVWSVAPFGDFTFRGTKSAQLKLGLNQPDFEPLKRALVDQFGCEDWVTIDDILDFVASDKTDYHTSQVRNNALIPLEKAGQLEAKKRTRNRVRTYPDGTSLRFRPLDSS